MSLLWIVVFPLLHLLRLNHAFESDQIRFPDPWCTKYCVSKISCLQRFEHDSVDLQLQLRFNQTTLQRYAQTVEYGIYLGESISRQTFEKHFILDVSSALGESQCRFHVTGIEPFYLREDVDTILLVSFRLISVNITIIRNLTRLIQEPESSIFQGSITRLVDWRAGLAVLKWDFSVKLMYQISTVTGQESLNNRTVIQEGSLRTCRENSQQSPYCEFELFFRQDIAAALSIHEDGIDVTFVTASGLDSVIVTFRFIPTNETLILAEWIDSKVEEMTTQITNIDSRLYQGNVTFRLDPTWGISGAIETQSERYSSKLLNLPVRDKPFNSYERCKDTRSCVRATNNYMQHEGKHRSTFQYFSGGKHFKAVFFADFEDWRQGTAGWKQSCDWEDNIDHCKPRNLNRNTKPRGAHWSPFDFDSLGPNIPTFGGKRNQGLVLNMRRKMIEIQHQKDRIFELETHVQWLSNAMHSASLDPSARFRRDIISRLQEEQKLYLELLRDEQETLTQLSSSQCSADSCFLLFNTSNLLMSGNIEARGYIDITPDGTEVAVWSFDSIDLGEEVMIETTGQRAMALLSRSSLYINTSIILKPGTLGGFPGGYSVARSKEYRLRSICREDINEDERESRCYGDENCCPGDITISDLPVGQVSNNINGPGSQSVRVHMYTIRTSSNVRHEIRTLRIDSIPGQTIEGGFQLHYAGYSTATIAHNVSAEVLQIIMENSLNAADISSLHSIERSNDFSAGIGKVQVSRYAYGASGGFEWKITFMSAVGSVQPLTFTSFLSGVGWSISIDTVVPANVITGSFSLRFFGFETRSLPFNITAADMKRAIIEDFSFVISADVIRTDPTGNCEDGLCWNGPTQCLGYTWTVTITTIVGNLSPKSPTSDAFDLEGEFEELTVTNNLGDSTEGQRPEIIVNTGYSASSMHALRMLKITKPFSLTYGASGGSYGGNGGKGSNYYQAGKTYGDKHITNLYGGSGGASGLKDIYQLNMAAIFSKARGGSGGGAVELVAQNDVVIGDRAIVSCNGEGGWENFSTAGGGGSGGSILISAGGSVRISGILNALGGSGGIQTNRIEGNGSEIYSSGGGGGGRIAIYGQSITIDDPMKLSVTGGPCQRYGFQGANCTGENGTIHLQNGLLQKIFINGRGAMETSSALIVRGIPVRNIKERSAQKLFQSGPEWIFQKSERPARISFFVKLQGSSTDKIGDSGALFEIRSRPWAHALNDREAQSTSAITIFIGNEIKHAANIFYTPSDILFIESMRPVYNETNLGTWYKIDIVLRWDEMLYDISVDNYALQKRFPFSSSGIHSIALSNIGSSVDVWFDEIYVGDDTNLGFDCSHFLLKKSKQYGWSQQEYNQLSSSHHMRHHKSHLSQREVYVSPNHGGIPFFDGKGHNYFSNDVKFRSGNESWETDLLNPRTLFQVQYITGETKYIYFGDFLVNAVAHSESYHDTGGIFACSTTDFITWKNEGLMLSYRNITNMVDGLDKDLIAKRPKVLFNPKTNKFVMWMIIENKENNLGMTGVAISDYAEGPFNFVRSFYADGNRTKDQTLYMDKHGSAFLIRTYYATVDYILPEAVMQPIWESVKDDKGRTHFGLNFHRANYEPGYDNFHDVHGNLSMSGVQSRFLDPDDPQNNVWRPNSVVGVRAQPWKANYRDGSCGIRLRSDNLELLDPMRIENRADCSNIVDNPTHPTAADRLIGLEKVVEKRRAKYVAVCKLTADFLDTTGAMAIYEGGLEDSRGIVSLIELRGIESLGWTSNLTLKSTYAPPVRDETFHREENWDTLFHQYEETYNDRAYYSLACILDKKCPVNFADQITES